MDYKEILLNKEAKDKIISGVNKLADAVKVTFGPNGKTVIITDEYGEPYATKDGVSVSNYIELKDPVENMGAQMIKKVAQKVVEEAGDGTTTSIILAQAFINEGIKFLENGGDYNELKENYNKYIPEIVKRLKKESRKLKKSDIKTIATISANNDNKIGDIINKAYKFSNTVKVSESDNKETSVKLVTGADINSTYLSSKFVNNEAKQTVEYDNVAVLLVDYKLNDLSKLEIPLTKCIEAGAPVLIIAEHVEDHILKLLEINKVNKGVKIVAIKTPGFNNHRKNILSDLSYITKASIIKENDLNDIQIGSLESIKISKTNSILIKKELVNVDDRIKLLKEYRDNTTDKNEKRLTQQRIDILDGKIAEIIVGGNSDIEMKETKDRVDDAVLAVKSALEEGVIKGAGITLYQTTLFGLGNIPFYILKPLYSCFEYLKPKSEFIIDPKKVTRVALENAASVALTILGTDAVVLNRHLWN